MDSCILIDVNQPFDQVLIKAIGVERGRAERSGFNSNEKVSIVHSNGTFPFSQPHICSLIRAYEMGHVKGGLQAKIVKLLKAHIPNEFPRIFGRRFRDLGMDQAAVQSFISPAIL